ncbi:sensor domain-containing protein [Ferrimicrobium acidiphilum]|nr:sensor domain-containing diguanylate cyclase [Ferrimicrobium acidiphilum]
MSPRSGGASMSCRLSGSEYIDSAQLPTRLVTGVENVERLNGVDNLQLSGHLGDKDFDAIVASLGIGCHVPIAVVNIVTPGKQTYAAEIGVGESSTSVPDEESFCAEVVNTGRSLVVADAATHRVYRANPLVRDHVVAAYAGEPLVDNGIVIGSVAIFDSQPREFTSDELSLLRHLAQLASAVLGLRRAAMTDSLTGLPNRAWCVEYIQRAVAQLLGTGQLLAVLFVDLDGFKEINDHFGHAVGDHVLKVMAAAMRSHIRPTDSLARLGGDEFVIICPDLGEPSDAVRIGERLLRAADDSMSFETGAAANISLSVGIAVTGDPHESVDNLLRRADGAMYRAKLRLGSAVELAVVT